jgi:glycine cleavage system H lipoate-binding protein
MVALFVIFTVVVCVVADSVVQWRKAKRESSLPVTERLPSYAFENVDAPAGVFLDRGHTWVEVAPSGRVNVGLDAFAKNALGRIDSIDMPKVGTEIRRGEPLFRIHQGKRAAEFVAPVDGVVRAVDDELARDPEGIAQDPYTAGWICSLSPKNLGRSLRQMLVAEEGRAWLKEEVKRFQSFFGARPMEYAAVGAVLQDGGQLAAGVLEVMDDATWSEFTEEFLHNDRVHTA